MKASGRVCGKHRSGSGGWSNDLVELEDGRGKPCVNGNVLIKMKRTFSLTHSSRAPLSPLRCGHRLLRRLRQGCGGDQLRFSQ
jgi:hypothetical protein